MNVMVIGGGGREHAIVKALKKNESIDKLYCLPGNGGIAADAVCVDVNAKDIAAQVAFAKANDIGFAVVAPDDPLVLGAVDALEAEGVMCFGPRKDAAIIEGSKVFSKALMKKYGIPTAGYEVFDDAAECIEYLRGAPYPTVVKADGLALGKGVIIAEDFDTAKAAVESVMLDKVFGASGDRVVVEEFLTGPEVSVLAFTDGTTLSPMVSSMDHKRALDNDLGKNTGGMGTIAPNPYYTDEVAKVCMEKIFLPTMAAMNAEGRKFKGCLYFGLMLTSDGPKVIEYNCRFGDPETQVVLPLLETDLFTVMRAVSEERLSDVAVRNKEGGACCVIMASGGYPGSYEKGKEMEIGETEDNVSVLHAGTKLEDGRLVTSGGRVLGVTAVAGSMKQAIKDAYAGVEKVKFEGAHYRTDIGRRALEVK